MKLGVCCTSIDKLQFIKEAGYDYTECALSNIQKMTAEEFSMISSELCKLGLKAEAFNGFFVGGLSIVGEDVDFDAIREYARFSLDRAASIGGKVAVIGSGKARNIPDGFSKEKGVEQFCRVLDICGDEAKAVGMEIVVEPLNKKETNFINTVKEGIEMAELCGNANVFGLADTYHMFMEDEDFRILEKYGKKIHHVHIARANADRRMPVPGIDDDDCKIIASALKNGGYCGRVSLEGSFKPLDSEEADFKSVINYTKPLLGDFK